MTSAEEENQFFYQLEDLTRSLGYADLQRIGQALLVETLDGDWRALGDGLAYSWTQLDILARQPNPGSALLKDWSRKGGSTIGALRAALERIDRHDVVTILDEIRLNCFTLYAVLHDAGNFNLNADVRGGQELWEGLLPHLQNHLQSQSVTKHYSLCELVELNGRNWRGTCNSLKGRQIDIKITHVDESPRRGNLEQVALNWHLLTPSELRFSRSRETITQPFQPSTIGTEVLCPNSTVERNVLPSAEQSTNRSYGSSSSAAQPSPPSLNKLNTFKHITTTETKDTVLCSPETFPLREETDRSDGVAGEEELNPVQCSSLPPELTGISEISLHSEDHSKEGEQHSTETTIITQAVSLRSPVEHEETELREIQTGLSLLDFRSEEESSPEESTDRKSLECETRVCFVSTDDPMSSHRMPDLDASSPPQHPDAGSNDEAGLDASPDDDENDRIPRGNDTNLGERTRKRHAYYGLPSAEAIQMQYPELWDIPGFHPKMKHKTSLLVTRNYEQDDDGWYLIRVFNCDDDPGSVQIAISVTHSGKTKHYKVHHHQDSSPRRYFLFNHDFESTTIEGLIDHYRTHSMVPSGYDVDLTKFPKLIRPIPNDSSCFRIDE